MEDKEDINKKHNEDFNKLFALLNSIAPYDCYIDFYSWSVSKQYPSVNKKDKIIVVYTIQHNTAKIHTDKITIKVRFADETFSYTYTIIETIEYIKKVFNYELRKSKIKKLLEKNTA